VAEKYERNSVPLGTIKMASYTGSLYPEVGLNNILRNNGHKFSK
jgi:hypothetical protein